jgi:hypothetical protein
MSHYIVARVPGEHTKLQMGILALSSLRHSGFDLYDVYKAHACHAGISGSGDTKAVDHGLARQALARAFGWAEALREAWPDDFARANPDWPGLFTVAPLHGAELQTDALLEYLDVKRELEGLRSDADRQARACSAVREVVAFAEAVYLGSRLGPSEIRFA